MNKNPKSTYVGSCVFFTAPFVFAYQISKGADFSQCFKLYLCTLLVAYGAIRLINIIVSTIQKRHQISFKKPPALPEWTAVVGFIMASTIAITTGMNDGFTTGMIIFWPGAFFSMGIIHLTHWTIWQIRGMKRQSLSIRWILGF